MHGGCEGEGAASQSDVGPSGPGKPGQGQAGVKNRGSETTTARADVLGVSPLLIGGPCTPRTENTPLKRHPFRPFKSKDLYTVAMS